MFLDEIGNLPLGVQQMLLCAIQDRRYRPVGGTKDRKANVRIITATNENLEEAISERRFRRDLYFRLSEYTVKVPPLRECPEDILPLAEFFRELYNQEHGRQVKGFDAEAKKRLLAHDWPGNVRELKQAVQSAVLFAQGELVTAEELNLDESGKPSDPDIALKGECMEKKRICQALEKAGHNRKEAARLLGISRSTLYEKWTCMGFRRRGDMAGERTKRNGKSGKKGRYCVRKTDTCPEVGHGKEAAYSSLKQIFVCQELDLQEIAYKFITITL